MFPANVVLLNKVHLIKAELWGSTLWSFPETCSFWESDDMQHSGPKESACRGPEVLLPFESEAKK